MSMRKPAAALAAAVVLTCAHLAGATEPQWSPAPSGSSAAQARPMYLADAASPAAPAPAPAPAWDYTLQGLLDKSGKMKEAGFTFGGWVEASWNYNTQNPAGGANIGRVFDVKAQDPTLNQIVLFLDKTVDLKKPFDVGGRMEWMWGADARFIHSNGLFDHGTGDGPENQFDLTQLYVDLGFGGLAKGLTVRVGKFVTPHGWETINPNNNPFYSHSFLFGYAIPFTHTGVMATLNLTDEFYVYAGMTRGWEQSLEDNNDCLDFLGGFKWTTSKFWLATNLSIGPQQSNNQDYRYLVDVCFSLPIGDRLTLGLNGDIAYEEHAANNGDEAWWYGLAAYLNYKLHEKVHVNARAEYFNDDSGARGFDTSVYEMTLGVDIRPLATGDTVGPVRIRPEVRVDYANKSIFDGGTDHTQWTFGVDVLLTF